jgi:hypothetical protein
MLTFHSHHIKTWYEEENQRLVLKMRDMRDELLWYKKQLRVAQISDEIKSLKESRLSPTQRDTENHHLNKIIDHTGRRETGRSSNCQQLANQRDRSKEPDFGRNRKLPPRVQNRNLPLCLRAPFKDGRSPANEIASLKVVVPHKERTVTQWLEVASGRRKIHSHKRESEAKPIPVIRNWYEVLNNCYISEYVN